MPKLVSKKRLDFDGYTVWTYVHDDNNITQAVESDLGGFYEVTPFNGIVFDETGIPGALAKIKDKSIFELGYEEIKNPPVSSLMFPTMPGEDPIKRRKVWHEIKEEGLIRISDHHKAMGRVELSEVDKEVALLPIKDVNLGTESASSSGELNKDYSVVEKGIGSSSDVLMKDNNVMEKGTRSSSDALRKDKAWKNLLLEVENYLKTQS